MQGPMSVFCKNILEVQDYGLNFVDKHFYEVKQNTNISIYPAIPATLGNSVWFPEQASQC